MVLSVTLQRLVGFIFIEPSPTSALFYGSANREESFALVASAASQSDCALQAGAADAAVAAWLADNGDDAVPGGACDKVRVVLLVPLEDDVDAVRGVVRGVCGLVDLGLTTGLFQGGFFVSCLLRSLLLPGSLALILASGHSGIRLCSVGSDELRVRCPGKVSAYIRLDALSRRMARLEPVLLILHSGAEQYLGRCSCLVVPV